MEECNAEDGLPLLRLKTMRRGASLGDSNDHSGSAFGDGQHPQDSQNRAGAKGNEIHYFAGWKTVEFDELASSITQLLLGPCSH